MKKKYQIIVGITLLLITGCKPTSPEITQPIIQNNLTVEGVDLIDDYMRVLKFYEQRDVLSTHRLAYLELKDDLGSVQTMEALNQFEERINAFAKELDDIYQMEEGTRVYRKGILVVDRGHCLPPSYEPGPRYEAENQFLYMQAAALKDGIVLSKISKLIIRMNSKTSCMKAIKNGMESNLPIVMEGKMVVLNTVVDMDLISVVMILKLGMNWSLLRQKRINGFKTTHINLVLSNDILKAKKKRPDMHFNHGIIVMLGHFRKKS